LVEIYGVILAYVPANITFSLLEIKTILINIGDKGYGLREVYMDGFILRYFLIKRIGILHRAVFYTGRTPRAFVF